MIRNPTDRQALRTLLAQSLLDPGQAQPLTFPVVPLLQRKLAARLIDMQEHLVAKLCQFVQTGSTLGQYLHPPDLRQTLLKSVKKGRINQELFFLSLSRRDPAP